MREKEGGSEHFEDRQALDGIRFECQRGFEVWSLNLSSLWIMICYLQHTSSLYSMIWLTMWILLFYVNYSLWSFPISLSYLLGLTELSQSLSRLRNETAEEERLYSTLMAKTQAALVKADTLQRFEIWTMNFNLVAPGQCIFMFRFLFILWSLSESAEILHADSCETMSLSFFFQQTELRRNRPIRYSCLEWLNWSNLLCLCCYDFWVINFKFPPTASLVCNITNITQYVWRTWLFIA